MGYSIYKQLSEFYNDSKTKYQRYNSWKYCYSHFHNLRIRREYLTHFDYDLAALHLANYLSSWGMYRGSAFLLQNDYKVHTKTVKVILENDFLWKISWNKIKKDNTIEETVKKILIFVDLLKDVYSNNSRYSTGAIREIKKWDTLPTKILLGTVGCVPAYDENFKTGLGNKHIPMQLGKASLIQAIQFYRNNRESFERSYMKNYPPMKLLDMCFWMIGKKINDKKKNRRKENQLKLNKYYG